MLNSAAVILSIHYGHNATVGLSVNGKIVCLLSEERIIRLKNATGFPFKALDYVISTYLSGDISKVDHLVLCDEELFGVMWLERNGYEPKRYIDYYYKTRKKDIFTICKKNIKKRVISSYLFKRLIDISNKTGKRITKESLLEKISQVVGIEPQKIILLHHHQSHAYSGLYFTDPSDRYLVFTLDGQGEGICATVNKWEDNELKVLSMTDHSHSLGYLYSEVTAYLGMKSNEHEFKVMGMAPYADHEQASRVAAYFSDILWMTPEGNFTSRIPMMDVSRYLIENLIYERFDIIAGAIQKFTEEIVCQWITFWIKKTGIHSVSLSGGVFMNVKAAQVIAQLPEVQKIFIVPSSGDESTPIGGIFYGNKKIGQRIEQVTDLYLGREYSDDKIGQFIEINNLHQSYHIEWLPEDEMAKKVAQMLADDEIVARCSGKEEWGARALGNRSILCNPSNFLNVNILNQKIKNRDFWMPFTPTVIFEDINDYVNNPKQISMSYMSITFESTERSKKEVCAAIHPKDHTMRPQAIEKSWNPGYYKILCEFKKLTGISAILNTSFNLHGEPNVGSPEDAIHTMENSDLNHLILGNYLLTKKTARKSHKT